MIGSPHILVVATDTGECEHFRDWLRQEYATAAITVTNRYVEAEQFLRTRDFHLVIVVDEPETDNAPTLIRRIKNESQSTPVIFITEREARWQAEEARKAGAAASLFRDDRLLKKLGTTIRRICQDERPVEGKHTLTVRGGRRRQVDLVKITAGTLHHEIGNPLMTILGMAELILSGDDDIDPEVKDKINAIHASASRIQDSLSRLTSLDEPSLRDTAAGPLIDTGRIRVVEKSNK